MPTFSFYAFYLEINETWPLHEKPTKLFWVISLGICFVLRCIILLQQTTQTTKSYMQNLFSWETGLATGQNT